ncbi:Plexin domain-containing protein 2 [Gryllus bimaculatus]|nr:Plexin domain-containing protein 2 [Gryllus bimaculatus]
MAMLVRWLSACICVFLLVSCGNGVQLSHAGESYYRYDSDSRSMLSYSDVVLKNEDRSSILRAKRYLAGEFDDLSLGRMSLTSDTGNVQDSGGKSSGGSNTTTTVNDTANGTLEPEATRISSKPVNASEPKTGGNYMSAHNVSSPITPIANATNSNQTVVPLASPNATNVNVSTVTTESVINDNATVTEKNTTVNMNDSAPTSTIPGKINSTVSGDDITIANFEDDNVTLTRHNITSYKNDSHVYYNSTFVSSNEKLGKYYWIDMDSHPHAQTNDMLSQSHRRAATVKLSFDFPFYGHTVRNVTIATGGFLYTGDYVHSWLAATQYIAPLMANFDTSLSNESYVKYMDNGTQFTVQWDKVKLQDKQDSGVFTFQATLRKTGDIIFVYQSVPVVIIVRRKTIYEYHRITFEQLPISNWTVINLIALPTCLEGTDCESCLSRKVGFECFWCPKTKKCSNGIDRNRQEWIMSDCDSQSINNVSSCPAVYNIAEVEKSTTTLPSTPELEMQTEQTVTAIIGLVSGAGEEEKLDTQQPRFICDINIIMSLHI